MNEEKFKNEPHLPVLMSSFSTLIVLHICFICLLLFVAFFLRHSLIVGQADLDLGPSAPASQMQ